MCNAMALCWMRAVEKVHLVYMPITVLPRNLSLGRRQTNVMWPDLPLPARVRVVAEMSICLAAVRVLEVMVVLVM